MRSRSTKANKNIALPEEVLREISEIVESEGRIVDLTHLRLCNKRLYAVVTPVLYQHIVFDEHSFVKLFGLFLNHIKREEAHLVFLDLSLSSGFDKDLCQAPKGPTPGDLSSIAGRLRTRKTNERPIRTLLPLPLQLRHNLTLVRKLTFDSTEKLDRYYNGIHADVVFPIISLFRTYTALTGTEILPNLESIAVTGDIAFASPEMEGLETASSVIMAFCSPQVSCTDGWCTIPPLVSDNSRQSLRPSGSTRRGTNTRPFRIISHGGEYMNHWSTDQRRHVVQVLSFRKHDCVQSQCYIPTYDVDGPWTCNGRYRARFREHLVRLYLDHPGRPKGNGNGDSEPVVTVVQGQTPWALNERQLRLLTDEFEAEVNQKLIDGQVKTSDKKKKEERVQVDQCVRWIWGEEAKGYPPCPVCGSE
ncbi:hypothetical protein IAT40_001672 [Kwoniella sp. CBS 6097]